MAINEHINSFCVNIAVNFYIVWINEPTNDEKFFYVLPRIISEFNKAVIVRLSY